MSRYLSFGVMFLLALAFSYAQETIPETLETYNVGSVPYISTAKLAAAKQNYILLDTRKIDEFQVSHLEGAIWVGFEEFDENQVVSKLANKNAEIVVYCSVGVRSEQIGEKLKKLGYTQVRNLYGGIFAWKNAGYPVVDLQGAETDKVHAFDQHWGKLLTKGEKVYTKNESKH